MITPMYDPLKDKIVGCKKGSIFYKHEQGHQDWFRKDIETQFQSYMILCLVLAVFSLAMDNRPLAIFLSSLSIIFYTIPEIHAWWYAFTK